MQLGGFFDGDVVFFQGTLLIDCDLAAVVSALKVPRAKLERHGSDSAASRMVTLHELLGDALPLRDAIRRSLVEGFCDGLQLEAEWGVATAEEESLAKRLLREEIGTDAFVYEIDDPARDGAALVGTHASPGGTITAYLKIERSGAARIGEALITGDFFAAPPRLVLDLEAALRGVQLAHAGEVVERFFRERRAEVLSVAPADFRAAVERAGSERA